MGRLAERTHSVRLRLELDQLRRDAAQATQSIGGIGSAAAEAGKQSRAMDLLGNAARGVGRTLAGVGTVAVGAMAALGASTIATGISYNTLEQSTRAALTTLLGGAEAATAQMDKLREFVRTALFPREVFIQGQQQLLAFGTAAEDVIPILDAVQNAVAATGGSAQIFGEVVNILAEMQSTGRITAQELNELARRGINAAQLIGQAMGKTEAEIRESITAGAIDGREAIELLVGAMETRFAGAAALISNTWTGALGLVTAGLRDIGSALVEPFIDPRGGGAAVLWAQNLAEVLYALERQVRDVVAVFRTSADPTFRRWGDLLADLAERIDEFNIDALLDSLREGAPALAGLGAAAAAAGGQAALGAIGMGSLAGAISPLGAAITAAVIASPELRQVLMDLLAAVQPLLPVLLDTGVALATGLSTGLAAVADLLTPLVGLIAAVVEVFTALPEPIQSATVGLAGFALALRFGGPAGAAIAVLTTLGLIFESFGDQAEEARTDLPGLVEDLERLVETGKVTAGLSQLFGEGAEGIERFADALDSASEGAFTFENWNRTFDEIDRNKQVFRDLDQAMAAAVEQGLNADEVFQAVADTYELNADQVDKLRERLPNFIAEAERQAEATADAGGATDELTEGQEGLAGATESATSAMREQAEELKAQTDPVFALMKGLREARDAQDAYNQAVEDFGAESPEAAEAAQGLLEAAVGLSGAAGDATGAFDGKLTPAMRTALVAAGFTEEQIEAVEEQLKQAREQLDKYEGRYGAQVELEGAAAAERAARQLRRQLDAIDRFITISFRTEGAMPRGGLQVAKQHGGPIDTGPPGVDRVPALLTRGEHVWTVREVEAAGGHQAVEALRAAVLGQATRFAVGGPVGVPRMQAGGAVDAAAMAAGINIENLNLRAFSDMFSLAQIEQQMRMYQDAVARQGAS